MGLWAKLFGRGRAAPAAAPAGLATLEDRVIGASPGMRGPPRRGTRELIAAYREQPWLRAVTSRIARGVASASWCVYARASEPVAPLPGRGRMRGGPTGTFRDVGVAPSFRWGRDIAVRDSVLERGAPEARAARRRELAAAGLLREVSDHPLLDLLQSPNPQLTGRSAMSLSQIWLDIKGEAFWLLSGGADGVPTGYWPLPPHWVTAVPTASRPTFTVSAGGLQLEVKAEGMVWLRDPDPENPYGRGSGVAESLGDELETDEYAAKYLKSWFYNSAIPSFIVSFEGADPKALVRAKEKWDSEHRGVGNAHKSFFSDGKMNAVRLDASFREQQISDLRKLSRDFVAQVFAMPPEVIGIIENSNRATISAARYIYALGVEFPRVEFLRTELQQWLAPRYQGAITIEAEVQVPDDEAHRLDVMRAQPAVFACNEWRQEAGYEPLPEFEGRFPALMPGQEQPGKPAGEKPEAPEVEEPEDDAVPGGPGEVDLEAEPERSDPPWAKAPL